MMNVARKRYANCAGAEVSSALIARAIKSSNVVETTLKRIVNATNARDATSGLMI